MSKRARLTICMLLSLVWMSNAIGWNMIAHPAESPLYKVNLVRWSALPHSKFMYEFEVLNKSTGSTASLKLRNDTDFLPAGVTLKDGLRFFENYLIISGSDYYSDVVTIADLSSNSVVISFRAMSHTISPNGRFIILETFRSKISPPEATTSVLSYIDLSAFEAAEKNETTTRMYAGKIMYPEGATFGHRESVPSKRRNLIDSTWLWNEDSGIAYVIALRNIVDLKDRTALLLAIDLNGNAPIVEEKILNNILDIENNGVISYSIDRMIWAADKRLLIMFESRNSSRKPNYEVSVK